MSKKQTLESTLTKINEVKPQPLTEPQFKPPVITIPQTLPPTVQPKASVPQTKQEYKPLPPETKILLDAFEEFEGILYAARNKIYQLYGPVDYQAQNSTKPRSIEDIRMSFPEEIEIKLDFIEQDNKYIIKAKQFLGSDTFAKVANAIKGMGGQYISAGKESRFEIRKF
jgi:hypothetical protein